MSDNPLKGPTPADFFNWIGQYVQPMMENNMKILSQMAANSPTPTTPPINSTATGDPFAMWRSFYDQNEQTWAKFMQQFVGTSEFAAGLGAAATQQATLQNNIRQTALSYLKAAHMPSQDDVTRLATLLVALDAKVDDLQDNLEDFLHSSAKTAPAEQNDRITALENRLAAIETKLDRLLEALQTQAEKPAANRTTRSRKTAAETEA